MKSCSQHWKECDLGWHERAGQGMGKAEAQGGWLSETGPVRTLTGGLPDTEHTPTPFGHAAAAPLFRRSCLVLSGIWRLHGYVKICTSHCHIHIHIHIRIRIHRWWHVERTWKWRPSIRLSLCSPLSSCLSSEWTRNRSRIRDRDRQLAAN